MKLILGPLPCRSCRAPVTVVRRDVEQPCMNTDLRCGSVDCWCATQDLTHTHTIPDVGPFTAVDDDGSRHECQE